MLTALREDVARRAAAGEELGRIEAEVVGLAPVDEERRAALWLFAWLRTQEPETAGRRTAHLTVAHA